MNSTKKHPFGILAIIVLQIIYMVINIIHVFELYLNGKPNWLDLLTNQKYLTANSALLFSLLGIAIVYGLWRLKRWGWVLLMIQIGVTLFLLLLSYFNGDPHYIKMVVNVLMVFYLNQRDIQTLFSDVTPQEAR